jgi:hypothetical protein
MSGPGPASVEELARLVDVLDTWGSEQVRDNPTVSAWERIPDEPRLWFLRLRGEAKDVSTIRWRLGQRTLQYESYFMPAPEENHEALYEHLLRRNAGMYGGGFCIGEEDALYLTGRLDRSQVHPDELDRVLGSMYTWIEQYFVPAIRIGFASRFG